ncbi:tetratricopeptide repeat protein [Dyella choica]|uniref:Sel1 repeat family protein n=1 Tax=Dyella choica TaxID=1927959 RepID=A0A3S0Q2H2_9GAMM|nr:tetratricopeptide repeat protein [Dyella choica]RUL70890.1 sel1 repeat family protein [Dyella choica]
MSEGDFFEIAAYIASGQVQTIAAAMGELCEREGMRLIERRPGRVRSPGEQHLGYGAFAVLPGREGWSLVVAWPWNFLCRRPAPDQPIRFVSLCQSLGAPGFLYHTSNHGDYGTVHLETDGKGHHALSGFMYEHERSLHGESSGTDSVLEWFGEALQLERVDSGLAWMRPLLPPGMLPEAHEAEVAVPSEPSFSMLDEEGTRSYADYLAGECAKYWHDKSGWSVISNALEAGGPLPIPGSVLLPFHWSAKDEPAADPASQRCEPERTTEEKAYYEEGEEILEGDCVRLEDGRLAVVNNFMLVSDGKGRWTPDGVSYKDASCSWVTPLAAASKFKLVSRSKVLPVQQPIRSLDELERAADAGNSDAQYLLGRVYMRAEGVVRNRNLSVWWMRKAAEQGHAHAQYELGECLYGGRGALMDTQEAAHWYRQAAEQGHTSAQLTMSKLCRLGFGVSKDADQAKYWADRASDGK